MEFKKGSWEYCGDCRKKLYFIPVGVMHTMDVKFCEECKGKQ